MNDSHIMTLEQVRQFLEGTAAVELSIGAKEDRYTWIQTTLVHFHSPGMNLSYTQVYPKITAFHKAKILLSR